ncbi:MAG: molybdopterin cofactor-binding domain-containing protein, partial [Alphaproteobacteria bacterium]
TGPYAVSQPVTRTEDPRLLTGRGNYTDDKNLPGQAHAAFLRSPVGHAVVKGIDTGAAESAPGVLLVLTHKDIAEAGFGTLPNNLPLKSRDGTPLIKPPRPVLATDKVRHLGQPVAHDEAPGNVCLDFQMGDADKAAEGFARAAHVTKLRLVNNRCFVSPMEPRAAIGDYDTDADRWVLHVCSQGVMGMRNVLANAVLNCEPEKLLVLTSDVGGSFGMKSLPYNEYPVVLLAAKTLGRPVKWTADRSEACVSDHQGRAAVYEAELA